MKLLVNKISKIGGTISPPPSKSHSVRALFIASLAKGTSIITDILDADDTRAAIEVCKKLGATVSSKKNKSGNLTCTIKGKGTPLVIKDTEIFTGDSGITTTFVIPILGLRKNNDEKIIVTCGEQMRKRPLSPIIMAVGNLGMKIVSKNGTCPLETSGELIGGRTEVDGQNSQHLSALLLSLPLAKNNSVVTVKNLQERPYIEMTLAHLKEQNVKITHTKKGKTDTFAIQGNQKFKPFKKIIPGDFSSASYLIAAAVLLPGKTTIEGLNMKDSQGDKAIIPILQQMGAQIEISKNSLVIVGGGKLRGMTINCKDIPDMVPTLAVIATQAEGKTTLKNIGHARIKETDRIKSMATELKKMGVKIEENATSLIIYRSKLYRAKLNGYNDHRTIMALAIAGLLAEKTKNGATTEIDTAEGITKTFPNFTTTMNSIGTTMRFNTKPQHIILIGFKNSGKSIVGSMLAKRMRRPFVDLDEKIQELHEQQSGKKMTCRKIMEECGEIAFREMENTALNRITEIENSPIIISVGGGTPMMSENQKLMNGHHIIHISAPKSIVFERIMINGKPAFFPKGEEAFISFQKLWNEREPIFQKLATISINNNGSIEQSVEMILNQLPINALV